MLRLILLSFIVLLFNSCAKDSIVINTIEKKPLKELNIKTISKIVIPVRERGYSNFDTTLMTSQKELNGFINRVKSQKGWNKRENFLNALALQKIDFTLYNFLIYRMTKASSSTVLLVHKPIGDKSNIIIKIGKNSKEMRTEKMGYYALGYKISKAISKITFDNGTKKEIIKNTASSSNSTIPKSCLEWFDGCNNCSRNGDGAIAPTCTEKSCLKYEPFKVLNGKRVPHSQSLNMSLHIVTSN
jgi:hypothetical protein